MADPLNPDELLRDTKSIDVVKKEIPKQTDLLEELAKIFESFSKNFTEQMKDQEKFFKDATDYFKSSARDRKRSKPNTGGGGGGGGGGGRGAAGGADDPKRNPGLKRQNRSGGWSDPDLQIFYFMNEILSQVDRQINKIEKTLFGVESVIETTFGGMIGQEREFTQQVRAAAFEIAGVTKESRDLQRAYEDIGLTVAATGFDRTFFQKEYIKNLRRGIKDQKVAHRIALAELNTERMIGVEAGTLSDHFAEMHHALDMNTDQISEMGRGMQDVARFTGITGDKLVQAVQSSQQFVKSMRSAATLTANAAKNILEISANAQKFGATEQIGPLMKAMSSSSALLQEASGQTRALLFRAAGHAGRVGELMNGTVLKTKAGIRDMAKGMKSVLRDFGVESVEAIDKMSDQQKMALNLQLKAAYGIELGDLRAVIHTLDETGLGMADRLANINKKLKENLTLEERAALKEEERKLKTSKNLEVMTALSEAAKGTKTMSEALGEFGKRRQDFEEDMKAMGMSWSSEADVARFAIQKAVAGVNESLKASGKKEISIDSSRIEKALRDPAAYRQLSEDINKAAMEAGVAQKTQLDPMTESLQMLREINDSLRDFTQTMWSKFMNLFIAKMTIIIVILSTMLSHLALASVRAKLSWENYGDLKKRMANSQDPVSLWEALKAFGGRLVAGKKKGGTAGAAGAAGSAADAVTSAASSKLSEAGKTMAGGTVEAAGGAIEKFNKFFNAKMVMTIAKGALALLILAPAVTLLAGAVVKFSGWMASFMGLDAETASKTGKTVSGILWAAGEIALAVVVNSAALAAIGLAVKFGLASGGVGLVAAAALIGLGAVGLMVLAPAMIALATGVIKISQGVMSLLGIDAETGAKTAAAVASILWSAAKISMSVVMGGAALATLGAAVGTGAILIFAALAIPGAKALMTLTPGAIMLADSVIKMTQGVLAKSVNVEEGAKTASALAALLESAGKIMNSVLWTTGKMGLFGLFKTFTPLGWIYNAMVNKGAKAIEAMGPAISTLAVALNKILVPLRDEIPEVAALEEAMNKLTSLKGVLKSLGGLAAVMGPIGLMSLIGLGSGVGMLGVIGRLFGGNSSDPSSKVISQKSQKKTVENQEDATRHLRELKEHALTAGSIYTRDVGLHDLLSRALYGSSQGSVVLPGAASNVSTAARQPGDLDIEGRLQREQSGSMPKAASVTSPELGKIAGESEETNALLARLIGVMEDIKKQLQPAPGGSSQAAAVPETVAPHVQTQPPRYFKWNTGKHNQTAGKAALNIGSTSY